MSGADYAEAGASGSRSVFWSAISVAGRQILLLLFSLLLARLLGPDAYGVIAQAAVFISLSTLLMDQGVTAALIQAKSISRRQMGAAAGLNATVGLVLLLVSLIIAEPLATFFRTPELASVLGVLGGGLILKALAVVPRMMLVRSFDFRAQALVDVTATTIGGVAGIIGAFGGMGYWALVMQILITDLIIVVGLWILARPPLPNARWAELRASMGFSTRVLFSNLISFSVQNLDTVLIGRTMSTQSLAYYSLAYRVLTTPIQLVGQVVTRVMFPAISRLKHNGGDVPALIAKSVQTISLLTFPAMALVAVTAPVSVPLVLGEQWAPAIPVLMVFAIGGARQSITTVNTSVVMGMGRSDVSLKFSLVAAATQLSSIVIGLQGGIIGVAIAFTAAGFLLTPLICVIQKRVAGFEYRQQFAAVLPPLHATAWLVAVYGASVVLGGVSLVSASIGSILAVTVYLLVLRFVHRRTWHAAVTNIRAILGR
ncbi:lipopolysaccharide biosynthesis protein [Clavibacter phaseoli]|uniref:lipopolysaccharide biosynthesis protein n=1 Tax=Clavibacter phaseoli TaxID=1734031 RepID=UPI0015FA0D97|nr:lipopolysaccharide biosynthesis protein [Clavibacter phaseoli]